MPRKLIRRWIDRGIGNDWERLIRRARRRRSQRFVLLWNRGLGDIALGLCQVVDEMRREIPGAVVTIVTRADLAEAFRLLPVDRVVVDPAMRRDRHEAARRVLRRVGINARDVDHVVARIDPTRWFRGRSRAQPRLAWSASLDALAHRFDADFADATDAPLVIGVHVQCETARFYSYRKDWPPASWAALFERLGRTANVRFVLFGHRADVPFDDPSCIDLRGRTTFVEMMAVIKRRCAIIIAPDSGVLTMTYYLDDQFPIGVISLWADPRQGILAQGAPSPNRLLRHEALSSADERVASIGVDDVIGALERLVDRRDGRDLQGGAMRRDVAA